jgi:exportin-1
LNKLNLILIQILKFEWPKNWPTFISELVGASRTNEAICQNNMEILKLLSEEVFDFSSGQMTQAKAKNLKESMNSEFQQVFELCIFIMSNTQTTHLINVTLETLLRFLNWIPLGYIFETDLIQHLVSTFFVIPAFRNVTLKCLTEIVSIKVGTYQEKFILLFRITMTSLKQMLPLTINLRDAFQNGTSEEQNFIQNLSLFITAFLKDHVGLIEKAYEHKELLNDSLGYLVLISEVDDVEIFKICLEYWNILAADLYREAPYSNMSPILLGIRNEIPLRRHTYQAVLSRVRAIMISKMAKPEEVLVVENDQGEVVREYMKDTDSINLYKTMRETLGTYHLL